MNKNDLIKIISVSKNFGDTKALNNISFSIPKNSVLGLLGPNGSGKSTLMRIISGLIKKWEGNIFFDNKSTKLNQNNFLNNCGFLIEEPTFYDYLTARQNLSILARLTSYNSSNINEILSDVDLKYAADLKVSNFSYGMKQRLGIAQAILHDPDILFLDEPNNGLDPLGIRKMNNIILNLHNRGKTIVVSTHILHDVEELCSDIVILKEGKLLLNTSMNELLKKSKTITIKTENIKLLEDYINNLANCKLVRSGRKKITIKTELDVCALSKLLPKEISITSIIKDHNLSEFFR